MGWWIMGTEHLKAAGDEEERGLGALYEGQLDAVLHEQPTQQLSSDPADHACHGCALDPTTHKS